MVVEVVGAWVVVFVSTGGTAGLAVAALWMLQELFKISSVNI